MKHAKRKNRLPNIAQKLPILDIVNPIADTIKRTHPKKLIFLLLIFFQLNIRAIYEEKLERPIQ